ncbi:hypothetical protein [Lysobacter sp.]|uniref:hypothetical protein n=1 Tax=Lysobacter sp. TaxID=72226 RepID=UPI002D289AA7|nr:hypothetical protein [Lysobacter sp.]HZX76816.1 hypothetical protein [Lysobacter sp.]
MKLPEWAITFAGVTSAFAVLVIVPFLIYWYAPEPWCHVASIFFGCMVAGGFVTLMSHESELPRDR